MYVTGRGTSGLGTILPALAEVSRGLPIDGVTLCATRDEGREEALSAAARVNAALGTRLPVEYRRADQALGSPDFLARHACAIVCVPDPAHFEVTRTVLEAGLHTLVVKPLVATVAEARKLMALQRARGVLGVVEFHKRFDEANLVVKRLVFEGRLGELSYGTVSYSQRLSIPETVFRAWAARTNVFQYLGVHYVDLLYFLTGFAPARASAIPTWGALAARGVDTPDAVLATVEWRNPATDRAFVQQLAVGWIDPEGSPAVSLQAYSLVGTSGRIECDQTRRGVEIASASGVEAVNPYFSRLRPDVAGVTVFAGYGVESVRRFVQDVADVRRGAVRPEALEAVRPSFSEALVSTAVVEAVNRSLASEGAWIPVEPAGASFVP